MAAWQTDSPPLPVWGDLRRFNQYPGASLRSVLEGNRTAETPSDLDVGSVHWPELRSESGITPEATHAKKEQRPSTEQRKEVDSLVAQAAKSKPDLAGHIRCQGCGKICSDHKRLAQHLKDKHEGVNSPTAPGSTNANTGAQSSRPSTTQLSLSDLLAVSSKVPKKLQSRTVAGPSGGLKLTPKQLKNVRGLAKAYPTSAELAKAIKAKLGTTPGTKKLSRLKRVILRERTDKAATAAAQAATAAKAATELAEAARNAVVESYKEAEAKLESEKREGSSSQPVLITQVQVLEMAFAEAERRLYEAERKARLADEEAAKAAAERSKAWKVSITGVEQEGRNESSDVPTDDLAPKSPSTPADDPHPAPQPQEGDEEAAAGAPNGWSKSGRKSAQQSSVLLGPTPEGPQDCEDASDSDPADGLQGFENVLAAWLHDAHQRSTAAGPAGMEEDAEDGCLGDKAPEEEVASEADSDGLGPDGWDDVLSAWMSNAGVLGPVQSSEPVEPDSDRVREKSSPRSASATPPRRARSVPQTLVKLRGGAATPRQSAIDLSQAQAPSGSDPIVFQQPSGFEAVISPGTRSTTAASPHSAGSATPKTGSLPGLLMGTTSDASAESSQSWMLDRPSAGEARGPDHLPLLADVLAGSQLSSDTLLDPRRVCFADTLAIKSAEEGQKRGSFAARAAGGGAVAIPEIQSRHSDIAAAPRSSSAGDRFRQLHSWGPWAGPDSSRWQDSGSASSKTSLLGGGQDSAAELASSRIDLFGGAAGVGAMADLGLPRLQSADCHVHGSRLYHNVLTAAQQKMLEDLPAPRNEPAAPGEPPLARLPSITGSAHSRTLPATPPGGLLEATSSSRTSPAWLAGVSSDEEEVGGQVGERLSSKRSTSLPSQDPASRSPMFSHNQSPHNPRAFHQQHFFGHPKAQPIIDQPQWPAAAPGLDLGFGANEFQGFPNPGPEPFQDPAARFSEQQMLSLGSRGTQNFRDDLGTRCFSADGGGMRHVNGRGLNFPLPGMMSQLDFPMPSAPPSFLPFMGPMMQGEMLPEMAQMQSSFHASDPHGGFTSMHLAGSGVYAEPMQRESGVSDWDVSLAGRASHGRSDTVVSAAHEFHCDVCRVTCCGMANFKQHCSSKKHLRRAAAAGAAAIPDVGSPSGQNGGEDGDMGGSLNPTYVGLQAQCRNYCKQVITTDLNRVVVELLQNLLFWQERSKAMNAHNAARKKRLVSGLREVGKAIKLRKAKTVIVTPNIEQIETEGGLDELLSSILQQAEEAETPVVFALSRKKLGQVFGCRKKMSAIAILDYSGAEVLFKQMEQMAAEGRTEWEAHKEAAENGGMQQRGDDALEASPGPASQEEASETQQSGLSPPRCLAPEHGSAREDADMQRPAAARQLNVQAPLFVPRA